MLWDGTGVDILLQGCQFVLLSSTACTSCQASSRIKLSQQEMLITPLKRPTIWQAYCSGELALACLEANSHIVASVLVQYNAESNGVFCVYAQINNVVKVAVCDVTSAVCRPICMA